MARVPKATSRHKQEQSRVILTALAQNPNTPRSLLGSLSFDPDILESILFNPILSLLALESPEWCKENLSQTFLGLAMPALYEQIEASLYANQGTSDFDEYEDEDGEP
jgi:hypothetical protein